MGSHHEVMPSNSWRDYNPEHSLRRRAYAPRAAADLAQGLPEGMISTVQGVLTHSRPIIAFSDAFASCCVIPPPTTVTPEGCPPTDIAVGKFAIKRGGIGFGAFTGPFTPFRG